MGFDRECYLGIKRGYQCLFGENQMTDILWKDTFKDPYHQTKVVMCMSSESDFNVNVESLPIVNDMSLISYGI